MLRLPGLWDINCSYNEASCRVRWKHCNGPQSPDGLSPLCDLYLYLQSLGCVSNCICVCNCICITWLHGVDDCRPMLRQVQDFCAAEEKTDAEGCKVEETKFFSLAQIYFVACAHFFCSQCKFSFSVLIIVFSFTHRCRWQIELLVKATRFRITGLASRQSLVLKTPGRKRYLL